MNPFRIDSGETGQPAVAMVSFTLFEKEYPVGNPTRANTLSIASPQTDVAIYEAGAHNAVSCTLKGEEAHFSMAAGTTCSFSASSCTP